MTYTMKNKRLLLITLLTASAAVQVFANNSQEAKPQANQQQPYSNEELLKTYGWVISSQSGFKHFGFTSEEMEWVVEGFKQGAKGENIQGSNGENLNEKLALVGPKIQEKLQEKASSHQKIKDKQNEKTATLSKDQAMEYFTKLEQNPNVKKTPSGLYYEITKEATGSKPRKTHTVKVHYKGTLINGDKFDSSYDRGDDPTEFPLTGVIPGFSEGLQLVGKGGSIRLHIPSELGYGDANMPGIPAGSTLIFDVEMVDFS